MRYIIFLLPLMIWAILPQSEMERITKQYHKSSVSSVSTHTFDNKSYYIILYVEEKLFPDDTLEEEKVYLKAGAKQVLFNYMKKEHPEMVSLEVSELLNGSFWEDSNFYHHIAQVRAEFVEPIFVTKTIQAVPIPHVENNNSAFGQNEVSMFSIKLSDAQRELQKKIDYLEDKSKKYPNNLKVLKELSRLYKKIGDTDGYAKINERIMEVKMDI